MESCYEHNNLGKRLVSDIRERILMGILDEWMERGVMVAVEVMDIFINMHSKLGVVMVNMIKIDRLKSRKVSRVGMVEMWEEEGQNQEEVEEGKSILEEMRESGRITLRYWLMNNGGEEDQIAKRELRWNQETIEEDIKTLGELMKVRKKLQKQGSIKDWGVSPIWTSVEWGVMDVRNKGSKSLCKHPVSEKGLRMWLDSQPEIRRKYKGKVWKWKMEKRKGKIVEESNKRKIMVRNGKGIT